MKYLDTVELIKERPEYTAAGVHVGDFWTIVLEERVNGKWFVVFSEFYTAQDIAEISVREEDLKVYDKIPEDKKPPKIKGVNYLEPMLRKCLGLKDNEPLPEKFQHIDEDE